MKYLLFIVVFLVSVTAIGQTEAILLPNSHIKPIEVVDAEFQKQYKYLKPRVIKVYPYALYAANVLNQLEGDLQSIEKRRKRNKHCKISYKELKSNFKYAMLDLYISEGKVLMSLIGRETGSTVYDIVRKYRGKDDAMVFNLMGKMFEQDIKAAYIKKENYVLEYIIREIEDGKIIIKSKPKLITKADFKEEEKRLKEKKKRYKALVKKRKKEARKKKRLMRRGMQLNF
ncbi:MAG: DUF4294 domain-containing protein [Crocinitomicaceae bacterium]